MNLKRITYPLVSILMIFFITACAPEDPNSEVVGTTPLAVTTDTEQEEVDQGRIEAILLDTPAHISKVFDEDFAVEADVRVPRVKKADIIIAKYMPFEEQKLLSMFYKGKTPQRSVSDYDDSIQYEDDLSYLGMNDGYLYYSTQASEYCRFPTEPFGAASDLLSSRRFGDVYTQENLGFMSRAEAYEAVSDIFEELSIAIMKDAESYAIDSATMQRVQEEEIQRLMDHQIPNPTDRYKRKEVFTPEDDFYLFFLKMTQNNIPVTQQSYILQASERSINGSTAKASFSRGGLIDLRLSGIYHQQGIAESPDTIISVEEALQRTFEKHESILSTDKVTVTAIDFEYVPVPYN